MLLGMTRGAWVEPVTLVGDVVVLEPLSHEHHDGLEAAAADGELWNLGYTRVPAPGEMRAEIDRRLALESMAPFTARRASDGQIIGMTTYMNIDAPNRRVEIGSTWNAVSAQRTGTNTESKLLLLGHAFEQLGCYGVEFRTDLRNHQSRTAIARLGAQQDGILRKHTVMADGYVRDTVVFSILDTEWPTVRERLQQFLDAR